MTIPHEDLFFFFFLNNLLVGLKNDSFSKWKLVQILPIDSQRNINRFVKLQQKKQITFLRYIFCIQIPNILVAFGEEKSLIDVPPFSRSWSKQEVKRLSAARVNSLTSKREAVCAARNIKARQRGEVRFFCFLHRVLLRAVLNGPCDLQRWKIQMKGEELR